MSDYSDTGVEEELPDCVTKDMSVEAVVSFLQRHGIPEAFSKAFESNYIDGEEFITLTEAEVRRMVPPIGLARKVIRLLPASKEDETAKSLGPGTMQVPQNFVSSTPPFSVTPEQLDSPLTRPDNPSLSSISSTPSSVRTTDPIVIPDHWRPEVEYCFANKSVNNSARNEIVRTLVNQLFAKSNKPSRADCDQLARRLILKYPFARDDLGNGYQSWSDKMVERVRNVIKRDRRYNHGVSTLIEAENDSQPKKKKETQLLQRYPISATSTLGDEENQQSLQEHKKAIATELAKVKPRDSVLLPLMKSTYGERRKQILHQSNSVQDILSEYPALSRPAIIDQEMCLIFGDSGIKGNFCTQWSSKYVPAILTYAEQSKKKKLLHHLAKLDESDETSKQLTAIKILSECLGKGQPSLSCLYEECAAMEGTEMACKKPPLRVQPRIAAIVDEDHVEYLIICEQRVVCKQSSLQAGLFTTIASYYCFNLEYPSSAKNLFCFFQDYVLARPDSSKKSGAYLGTVSDIKRCL